MKEEKNFLEEMTEALIKGMSKAIWVLIAIGLILGIAAGYFLSKI